jgi:hypothetical protein
MMSRVKPDATTPPAGAERIRGDEIEPEDVTDARLREGLALWTALRGQRLFPSRAQMSPRALGRLLPNTMLIKVLHGGHEFQVRLIGDAIVMVQDDPIQGKTTAEIETVLPGFGKLLYKNYGIVCALKAPIARRGILERKGDGWTFYREHLMLPLGSTDNSVDHILSLIVYTNPYGQPTG